MASNKSIASTDLKNVVQGHISQSNSRIVAFICASPHFFTLGNCLLYMNAPHKHAIYLFTTQVLCCFFLLVSSLQFFTTFWSLAIYDLQVPSVAYEKQIQQHRNQQAALDDNKELVWKFVLTFNFANTSVGLFTLHIYCQIEPHGDYWYHYGRRRQARKRRRRNEVRHWSTSWLRRRRNSRNTSSSSWHGSNMKRTHGLQSVSYARDFSFRIFELFLIVGG